MCAPVLSIAIVSRYLSYTISKVFPDTVEIDFVTHGRSIHDLLPQTGCNPSEREMRVLLNSLRRISG